jgi:hypothetical protein
MILASMQYPYCKVRPPSYFSSPCNMETLVLGPAVKDINYKGIGALHTMLPTLVQLSPVNADSLEPQAGENC